MRWGDPEMNDHVDDPETSYHQAERRLREILFGDGTFTPGVVKGEDRRLELTRTLRKMREAFDAAATAHERQVVETAQARIADLEEELRQLATARSGDRPDRER
jgi:hypothetical protein